jgi:hypothetical protein
LPLYPEFNLSLAEQEAAQPVHSLTVSQEIGGRGEGQGVVQTGHIPDILSRRHS